MGVHIALLSFSCSRAGGVVETPFRPQDSKKLKNTKKYQNIKQTKNCKKKLRKIYNKNISYYTRESSSYFEK